MRKRLEQTHPKLWACLQIGLSLLLTYGFMALIAWRMGLLD